MLAGYVVIAAVRPDPVNRNRLVQRWCGRQAAPSGGRSVESNRLLDFWSFVAALVATGGSGPAATSLCVSFLLLFRVMRNGTFPETLGTLVLDRVAASLHKALPAEWTIELSEPAGMDAGVDAVLDVGPPSGPTARFVIEIKLTSRGAARDTVRAARAASARAQRPAVVFTDFANPALRDACSNMGVGFVDETGWVSLRYDASPGLLVNLQGAHRIAQPREATNIARLDGPGASKIVRALWRVTIPIGVRELAEQAQVSPGTVAKVLPTLDEAGAIERDNSGVVRNRTRWLLLERWTQDYSFTGSNRDLLWLLAPRGVESLDRGIVRLPETTLIVSTGSLGARNMLDGQLLSVIPLTLRAYYTAEPRQVADQLGLRPSSRAAANVVLARPRDPSLLQRIGHGSVLSVPPVQVLADLMTMGGRFPDEAEQLFDSLYPDERRPRT